MSRAAATRAAFESAYRARYSFLMPERALIVEAVSVEAIGSTESVLSSPASADVEQASPPPAARVAMHASGAMQETPLYLRDELRPGHRLRGPALIAETNATTIVEPGWQLDVTAAGDLLLTRVEARAFRHAAGTRVDPVRLELFNNLFMSIAEQMGLRLANTAHSVNIKERLDFSCALFEIGRAHV